MNPITNKENNMIINVNLSVMHPQVSNWHFKECFLSCIKIGLIKPHSIMVASELNKEDDTFFIVVRQSVEDEIATRKIHLTLIFCTK